MSTLLFIILNMLLIKVIFVFLSQASMNYHVYKLQISQEDFERFLDQLLFPFSLYRKSELFKLSDVTRPELKYSKFIRTIVTISLLCLAVPFLAINFIKSSAYERIFHIVLWIIYVTVFVVAWRFGHKMQRFIKTK